MTTALTVPARPSSSRASRPLSAAWPIYFSFAGIPLWWVLGLFQLAFFFACIPMLIFLLRNRRLEAPRGLAVWLLYLFWLLGGLLLVQIDAPGTVPGTNLGRYPIFAYRLSWYVIATIFLLYIINVRRLLSPRNVSLSLGAMYVWLTMGGILGLAAPLLDFPSVLEILLPGPIANNGFVQTLIHPQVAQVQDFLGFEQARPSAPFPFANQWGASMALTAPHFLITWWKAGRWFRRAVPPLALLSIIPIVGSLNRGVWGAILVMLAFGLVQLARSGRPRALIAAFVALTLCALAVVLSPLGDLIMQRLDTPHSNEGRANLATLTISSAWNGSPLLGFGTTRDVLGNFSSIADGSTFFCPGCSPPPLGTQGQLWQVLYATGFVGVLLYLGFVLGQLIRGLRTTSYLAVASQCTLVASLVTLPVYNVQHPAIIVIFVSVGLLSITAGHLARLDLAHLTMVSPAVLVLAVLLACTGAGAGWLLYQRDPTPYSATQGVLVRGGGSGTTSAPVNLDTEAVLARSTPVLEAAGGALGVDRVSTGSRYDVSARVNSSVLDLTITDPDPDHAAAAVREAGETYLAERAERRSALLAAERTNLQGHLTTLLRAEESILVLFNDTSLFAAEDLDFIAPLRTDVIRRLTTLESSDSSPGALVGRPDVVRSSDRLLMYTVSGAWLGLTLAVAVHLGRSMRGERSRFRLPRPITFAER